MTTTALSVLLGVGGMLGWGVYDFAGGVLSKRLGSFPPLLWSQVAGAVAILAVATLVGVSWGAPVGAMLLACLAGALYCAGYLGFFAGFEKGQVSIVAAAMNAWAIVTMSVAFVFFGQRLTGVQLAGAIVILTGAVLASIDWAEVRRSGLRVSAGVGETLLGALFFGLYWNVSELLVEDLGWLLTTVLVKAAVVLVLLGCVVTVRSHRSGAGAVTRRSVPLLLGMGVVELGAVVAVNYGLVVGDAILVTPISSALSVVTIVLAVVVLRERISRPQVCGVVAAVVGIVMTAL